MQTLAAGAGGGMRVLLPPLSEVFWAGLALAIVVIALWKFALPKLTALLDERAEKIEKGLELSERAGDELEAARAQAAAELTEARTQAAEIRAQARNDAKTITAEAHEKAAAHAEQIREQAQAAIAASRAAAERELRSDVGRVATDLAARIVGQELTNPDVASKVIDSFLDELEKAPVKGSQA